MNENINITGNADNYSAEENVQKILEYAAKEKQAQEDEKREAVEKYLKTPCSLKSLMMVTVLLLVLMVMFNNKLTIKLDLLQAITSADIAQVKKDYGEMVLRLSELEKKLGLHDGNEIEAPIDLEPLKDEKKTVAEIDKTIPAEQSKDADAKADITDYEITFEKYAAMEQEVRIMLLKEHYRSASLAMKYFIQALSETNSSEFMKSEAGMTVTKLYSVWSAIEKDPIALQAVDILITQEKFFGRTFTEAAEVGGMAVLVEALSQSIETEPTGTDVAPHAE